MFKRLKIIILSLIIAFSGNATAFASIIVGSWNIQHLGWGENKRYDHLAHIAQSMDLIAVQEVMSEEGLRLFVEALEQQTGEDWESMASHAIGRGRYKEMYAFVWRDSAVEYSGGAVVFFDGADVFARQPFLSKFRDRETGQELAMANIHILYGDSVSDRLPEIEALLDIWEWMAEVYPDTPRVIAGDFNLKPTHPAWNAIAGHNVIPSIQSGATTLSTHDGRYANLYDNLWREPDALNVTDSGIIPFPRILGITHQVARKTVSDHAPVFIALDGAQISIEKREDSPPAKKSGKAAVGDSAPSIVSSSSCIDLNSASQKDLERLIHIGPGRATTILQNRPWDGAESLTRINGIGSARAQDIHESGMLCE